MSEDRFFDRLREDARPLRFEPDDFMRTRVAARIRERIQAPATASQVLARWFRPLAASLTAIALAATLGIVWIDRTSTPDLQQPTLESLSATNTIEISAAGDVYRVNP
ncbi:MAG TPA: hypothetical protein VF381_15005 [Thermoanaerobaculia bacterium]